MDGAGHNVDDLGDRHRGAPLHPRIASLYDYSVLWIMIMAIALKAIIAGARPSRVTIATVSISILSFVFFAAYYLYDLVI